MQYQNSNPVWYGGRCGRGADGLKNMPIFEYICLDCNYKFEELVMRSDAVITCPACQSNHVEKLVSTFSSTAVPSGASCSPSSCGKSSFG